MKECLAFSNGDAKNSKVEEGRCNLIKSLFILNLMDSAVVSNENFKLILEILGEDGRAGTDAIEVDDSLSFVC
jgi:hypothetical protein